MTTFFIDNSGIDTNTGISPDVPWSTHKNVVARFRAGEAMPGDEFLFRRGQVFQSAYFTLAGSSGLPDAPIVVGAYGTGALPVLDTDSVRYRFGIGRHTGAAPADWVWLRDLHVRNVLRSALITVKECVGWQLSNIVAHRAARDPDGSGWTGGVRIRNATGVRISDLRAYDIDGEGVYVGHHDLAEEDRSSVVLRNSLIRNCTGEGIDLKGGTRDSLVEYCTFENNGLTWENCHAFIGGQRHRFHRCLFRGGNDNMVYAVRLGGYCWDNEVSGRFLEMSECLFENTPESVIAAVYINGANNTLRDTIFSGGSVAIRVGQQPHAAPRSQVVIGCGFYDVATPIVYDTIITEFDNTTVSITAVNQIRELIEGGNMSIMSDLQQVEANLRQRATELRVVADDLDTQADLVVAQRAALLVLDQQLDDAADAIEVG